NDTENIKLASYLFPIIKTEYYNRSDFRDNNQNARMMKRVSSVAYFDRYFSYSISKNDIADGLFTSVAEKTVVTGQDIATVLQSPNQLDRFLEKITDNPNRIANKYDLCSELILFLEKQNWSYEKNNLVSIKIQSALYAINKALLNEPIVSKKNLATYLKIAKNLTSLQALTYSIRSVHLINHDESDVTKRTLNEDDYSKYKEEITRIIQDKMKKDKLPVAEYGDISRELYKYHSMFSGSSEEINRYMKKRVKTSDKAVDFISQFLNGWTGVGDGITHRSDLLDNNFAVYEFWFANDFDASYLYNLIVQSKKYAKYKNIPLEKIERFDRISEIIGKEDINREGNEQNKEFRRVIAQQFIYIFDLKKSDKKS
ncbi:MAG: hypothetical protein K6G49_01690, partial [Candidatus Saccharibacteria bacterium]|nr:hypothetical protein [Candidatus Saccharibacteria bacterium]